MKYNTYAKNHKKECRKEMDRIASELKIFL